MDGHSALRDYAPRYRQEPLLMIEECQQFYGESELRLGGAAAEGQTRRPKSPVQKASRRRRLRVRIMSSVNPKTARAGDAVQGELASDVLDEMGLIIVPRGTIVYGRLLGLETRARPYPFYTVALQFQDLSFAGEEYSLNLKAIVKPIMDVPDWKPRWIPRRMQLEGPSGRPGTCSFRMGDMRANLKGLINHWVTN